VRIIFANKQFARRRRRRRQQEQFFTVLSERVDHRKKARRDKRKCEKVPLKREETQNGSAEENKAGKEQKSQK
jgi:hypothetical protein